MGASRTAVLGVSQGGAVTARSFAEIAMRVVFAYFGLGILMNAISRSKPERYTMVPVATILSVVSLLVAMGYGELTMAISAR